MATHVIGRSTIICLFFLAWSDVVHALSRSLPRHWEHGRVSSHLRLCCWQEKHAGVALSFCANLLAFFRSIVEGTKQDFLALGGSFVGSNVSTMPEIHIFDIVVVKLKTNQGGTINYKVLIKTFQTLVQCLFNPAGPAGYGSAVAIMSWVMMPCQWRPPSWSNKTHRESIRFQVARFEAKKN